MEYSLGDSRTNKKKSKKRKKKDRILYIALAIIFILMCVTIALILKHNLGDSKAGGQPVGEESETQMVSDNETESDNVASNNSVSEDNASIAKEEEKEPVYKDLTLEEAWPIAQERNQVMKVTSGNVNVRERPTTDSDRVGIVKENSDVYIICEEDTNDGYTWCYVIYDKATSGSTTDSDGNPVYTIENKHYLGYIRKDLLH